MLPARLKDTRPAVDRSRAIIKPKKQLSPDLFLENQWHLH
jgi:hypothetical protein